MNANQKAVNRMRANYTDGSITFQEYYEWLATFIGVTPLMLPVSVERIKASTDEHLNDISLDQWDRKDYFVRQLAYRKGLAWALSDTVCTLKAIAKKEAIRERERKCASNHWNNGQDICADCGADLNVGET